MVNKHLPSPSAKATALRGDLFTFNINCKLADIQNNNEAKSIYTYIPNGIIIIDDGKIIIVDDYSNMVPYLQQYQIPVTHYPNHLLLPGFIDSHLHATQTDSTAIAGLTLLDWLQQAVFSKEPLFDNEEHSEAALSFFLKQLLSQGTTTACVYGPHQRVACDRLFELASDKNLCMIIGNVMMDEGVPDNMAQSVQQNIDTSNYLLNKWHSHNRLKYAVTPRFILSCSDSLMSEIESLFVENKGVYCQTHLSENNKEIAAVLEKYPKASDYLSVYESYNLSSPKTIYAHGIHLSSREQRALFESDSIIAWCPLSNSFLGSGLFPIAERLDNNIKVVLASDWGAGYSLSMLRTLEESYLISMLKPPMAPVLSRWFMASLGAAQALGLEKEIGSLTPGNYADIIALNLESNPILSHRLKQSQGIEENLFIISMLKDFNIVDSTYIAGEIV